ncbi:MAG: hypothetical protein ACXWC6_15965 [Ramlibacter sp.]
MDFEQLIEIWRQAEMVALVAEEAIVTIAQLADPRAHELLGKACELRLEANRLFEELAAQAMANGHAFAHVVQRA